MNCKLKVNGKNNKYKYKKYKFITLFDVDDQGHIITKHSDKSDKLIKSLVN